MKTPRTPAPIPPTETAPEPVELVVEDSPDVALCLAKRVGGWQVELLQVAGDEVLHREQLSQPEQRSVALERFRLEAVRRLFASNLVK